MALSEPCCPDSITKFLLDLFADKSTSGMFYTTDMMVLIDIVTRQLTDLGPGEEVGLVCLSICSYTSVCISICLLVCLLKLLHVFCLL